jgi:hypothetical protein
MGGPEEEEPPPVGLAGLRDLARLYMLEEKYGRGEWVAGPAVLRFEWGGRGPLVADLENSQCTLLHS